jgi:hypothetical protein
VCRAQSNDGLGGLEFMEDEAMGCTFARYTRRQVLQCMEGRSIVFMGDSMVMLLPAPERCYRTTSRSMSRLSGVPSCQLPSRLTLRSGFRGAVLPFWC